MHVWLLVLDILGVYHRCFDFLPIFVSDFELIEKVDFLHLGFKFDKNQLLKNINFICF